MRQASIHQPVQTDAHLSGLGRESAVRILGHADLELAGEFLFGKRSRHRLALGFHIGNHRGHSYNIASQFV